jgi:hypothetical protein
MTQLVRTPLNKNDRANNLHEFHQTIYIPAPTLWWPGLSLGDSSSGLSIPAEINDDRYPWQPLVCPSFSMWTYPSQLVKGMASRSALASSSAARCSFSSVITLASSCGAFLCSFFLCGTLSCCFFGVARSCVRALPLCLVLTDLYYQLGFKHLCSFYIVWQALVLFGAYLLYQQLGFKLLCSFC